MIASRRGLSYMVLDLDEQALTSELLDGAITRLERAPPDSPAR
ncbi:hypothetical protein [Asaia astilbis]|nr:hypothetical protein [Asaia astilbis]